MIRDLIRDVVGSAPYEKRLMELLKVGRDKRALKLAKRKVRHSRVFSFFFPDRVFSTCQTLSGNTSYSPAFLVFPAVMRPLDIAL